MHAGQDWHSLMWLGFPQVPESLVSPAVTRLDPQHSVDAVSVRVRNGKETLALIEC